MNGLNLKKFQKSKSWETFCGTLYQLSNQHSQSDQKQLNSAQVVGEYKTSPNIHIFQFSCVKCPGIRTFILI